MNLLMVENCAQAARLQLRLAGTRRWWRRFAGRPVARRGTCMGWSITLGSVRGTVVRLHVTFVLFLLWIAGVFYAQGGPAAAVAGVVFIALLFGCVVLHEFGHIFAARRRPATPFRRDQIPA